MEKNGGQGITGEDLKSLMDRMLEGCQVIGRDWRYLYVNDAVAKHGRKTREELLGRKMAEVYPGIEGTAMFAELKQCMEKRVSRRMVNEFVFPDGSSGWFELSIQPVPEGVFVLSIDVTERRKLEDQLEDYAKSLEEKVSERTKVIEEMGDRQKRLLSSLAYAANKLAVERNDVHIQVDLLFEAFDHLFRHSKTGFRTCEDVAEIAGLAQNWLVENGFMEKGQMSFEKAEEGLSFRTSSLCSFGEACKCLSEENVKINCPLGLLVLYIIKKCTGKFGYVVSTDKFNENGCMISLVHP